MADETKEIEVTTPVADEGKTSAPSQESKRTEKEKAEFSLKKNAERLKELGGDPEATLGVQKHLPIDETLDDDKPMTVGMYRDVQKKDATKTALQLADDIQDADRKQAVKDYLTHNIVPSGNAQKDFSIALGAASALKNKEVVEEITRYQSARKTASGGTTPAPHSEEFKPTADEARMMAKPYNLSKEKIIEARKRAEAKG